MKKVATNYLAKSFNRWWRANGFPKVGLASSLLFDTYESELDTLYMFIPGTETKEEKPYKAFRSLSFKGVKLFKINTPGWSVRWE